MADKFEKAKDEILFKTKGNGGPSNTDLLIAMAALAEDGDDKHAESMVEIKKNRELLEEHIPEANVRDERITALEDWRTEQTLHCADRVKRLIEEEHNERHNAYIASIAASPRRASDPQDADFSAKRSESDQARQVWFMWMIGSKISYILLAILIAVSTLVLQRLITGTW